MPRKPTKRFDPLLIPVPVVVGKVSPGELRAGFLSSLRHQGRARAEFAWRPTPFYTSVCGAWSPCRADYEDFLQDLEEDGDLRANVNIYKDSTTGGGC